MYTGSPTTSLPHHQHHHQPGRHQDDGARPDRRADTSPWSRPSLPYEGEQLLPPGVDGEDHPVLAGRHGLGPALALPQQVHGEHAVTGRRKVVQVPEGGREGHQHTKKPAIINQSINRSIRHSPLSTIPPAEARHLLTYLPLIVEGAHSEAGHKQHGRAGVVLSLVHVGHLQVLLPPPQQRLAARLLALRTRCCRGNICQHPTSRGTQPPSSCGAQCYTTIMDSSSSRLLSKRGHPKAAASASSSSPGTLLVSGSLVGVRCCLRSISGRHIGRLGRRKAVVGSRRSASSTAETESQQQSLLDSPGLIGRGMLSTVEEHSHHRPSDITDPKGPLRKNRVPDARPSDSLDDSTSDPAGGTQLFL